MEKLGARTFDNREKEYALELKNLSTSKYDGFDFFASFEYCFDLCFNVQEIEQCATTCLNKHNQIYDFLLKPAVFDKMTKKLLEFDDNLNLTK